MSRNIISSVSGCRWKLENDRNDSYLCALKQGVGSQTQMTVCLTPTNKKDRYDAIKKFTCVDHPGRKNYNKMQIYFITIVPDT